MGKVQPTMDKANIHSIMLNPVNLNTQLDILLKFHTFTTLFSFNSTSGPKSFWRLQTDVRGRPSTFSSCNRSVNLLLLVCCCPVSMHHENDFPSRRRNSKPGTILLSSVSKSSRQSLFVQLQKLINQNFDRWETQLSKGVGNEAGWPVESASIEGFSDDDGLPLTLSLSNFFWPT